MIISGVDSADLDDAIKAANLTYDDNITWHWQSGPPYYRIGGRGAGYRVRLAVKEVFGPGWRHSWKRDRLACWHVVGRFLDALPPGAEVRFDAKKVGGPRKIWRPGDQWYDWFYGLSMRMSEMCACPQADNGG